jgi:YD repeat-containing protein
LTQVVDSIAGTITRTYDGLDDLISEVTPQGSVSYTYDSGNRRTSMTVAGQPTVSYTYDNGNRLTQIAQGTATVIIGYDGANRRTSLTLPNGIVAAYGYDAASRLTSITYTQGSITLGNLSYAYDGNGRRVQMGGSLAAVNLPGAVASAVYNANNQLTQWGSATLTYDLNGNLTSDGTNSYTWNARNQLGALGGGTFAYDAFGRRTQNANGIQFLYDGANQVQELSGSTVTANLLTGLGVDEILTRTDSAGARSFLTDALGSSVALTDSKGAIQTRYVYQPFGNSTAIGSVSTNSNEYAGRENDGTGLYFYRARYYTPRSRGLSARTLWGSRAAT